MQRLGPGRRAKHLEVQTDGCSTVEQDRSHLVERVKYTGKCGRFANETRSKSSTRRAGRNDGWVTHCLMKKLRSFKSARTSIRITGHRKWQQLRFDDGENESLEDDVHSFVDKTCLLTTAVPMRCVEMNILSQPYLHRSP